MEISIIIPTHNRYAMLSRTLKALCQQTEDPRNYEVIVIADGCQDNTTDAIKKLSMPYHLEVIEQPDSGPGASRNKGAKAASFPLLLFIDDDVVPDPMLVREHLNAHKDWPGEVMLGYSPFSDELDQNDFANIISRDYWSTFFEDIASPHRFKFWELSSSNFSISRDLFEKVGGFDAELLDSNEDAELGFKLLKRQAHFRFVRSASAKHYAKRTEKAYFGRFIKEGRGQTIFVRNHPEALGQTSLSYLIDKSVKWEFFPPLNPARVWFPRQGTQFLFRVLWLDPLLAKFLIFNFQLFLRVAKIFNFYLVYFYIFRRMGFYLYWSGVQAQLGTLARAKQLVREALDSQIKFNEIDIDLKNDFNCLDKILDQRPVDAVSLHYGDLPIGRINPEIGAESLRSEHIYIALIDFIKKEFSCNEELNHLIKAAKGDKESATQILLFLDRLHTSSVKDY